MTSAAAATAAGATLKSDVPTCASFKYGGIAFTAAMVSSKAPDVTAVPLRSARVLVTLLAATHGKLVTGVSVDSPPGPAIALVGELAIQLS